MDRRPFGPTRKAADPGGRVNSAGVGENRIRSIRTGAVAGGIILPGLRMRQVRSGRHGAGEAAVSRAVTPAGASAVTSPSGVAPSAVSSLRAIHPKPKRRAANPHHRAHSLALVTARSVFRYRADLITRASLNPHRLQSLLRPARRPIGSGDRLG